MAHIEKEVINGVLMDVEKLDHSAQQVDDATERALPGGAIDTALSTACVKTKMCSILFRLFACTSHKTIKNEDKPNNYSHASAFSHSLSNKANALIGETGQPLDKARAFGFYLIANPTSGFPPGYTSDSHFTLFVTHEDPNWSPWLLMDLRTGATFRGGYTAGQFRAWEALATATPPQEYDLPLAEGLEVATVDQRSTYSKNQFGWVEVTVAVTKTPLDTPVMFVGTLPVGFRPAGTIAASCTVQNAGAFSAALCTIDKNGGVNLHIYTTQSGIGYAYAQSGFYAAT